MFTNSHSTGNLQLNAKNVARKFGINANAFTGYKNQYPGSTSKKTDYEWTSIVSSSSRHPVSSSSSMSNLFQGNDRGYSGTTKLLIICLCFFGMLFLLNFISTKSLGSDSEKGVQIKPSTLRDIQHQDEGFAALMDNAKSQNGNKVNSPNPPNQVNQPIPLQPNQQPDHSDELDELFDKIEKIEDSKTDSVHTINSVHSHSQSVDSVDEDPKLEEESMKSLRNPLDKEESLKKKPRSSSKDKIKEDKSDDSSKPHEYHSYPLGFSDPQRGLYILALIADNDKESKIGTYEWRSYLQHCRLRVNRIRSDDNEDTDYTIDLEWIAPPFGNTNEDENVRKSDSTAVVIDGGFSEKGRGMELSELVVFDRKLWSMDDRTGIIYEISREFEAIPRHIVMEGDGNVAKGMKVEWATYKEDEDVMYIGSIGREYTTASGKGIRNCCGLLWVATMDRDGVLQREDWSDRYMKLREATGTLFPGYLWIEAVEWSPVHRKWFIAPRYLSFEHYDAKQTEHRGANLLIVASEDFEDIELIWIQFEARHVLQRLKRNHKDHRNTDRNRNTQGGARRLFESVHEKRHRERERDESREITSSRKKDKYYRTFRAMEDLNMAQKRAMSLKQENIKSFLKSSDYGFSTMKFLEGTDDTLIVAIRTCEHETGSQTMESVLTVFDIDGNVFLNEQIPTKNKYEGIAVI